MPIYEYKCQACGHVLEAIQKVADDPLKDCPACATGQLRRLVSAAGFQLKGTGWYATDFKGGAKKPSGGDGGSSSSEGGADPKKKAGGGCGGGTCGCG